MQIDSLPVSELQEFLAFVKTRYPNGDSSVSVEKCVQEFQNYRSDLAKIKKDIQPALEQLDKGQSREIQTEEFLSQARQQSSKNAN